MVRNTVFHFDRAGLFYFISGVSGHCERGKKLMELTNPISVSCKPEFNKAVLLEPLPFLLLLLFYF
ncbi:hypothetical protein L484_017185 [Morus notabilis]|uniref:Phytocyanin domain-containing protein n=1 Tax=Morus notabilis TaxID=981085 RepID=W9QVQ1_9ROSA|nr:hypothetical protein L484_017185 [Morus notabilis]